MTLTVTERSTSTTRRLYRSISPKFLSRTSIRKPPTLTKTVSASRTRQKSRSVSRDIRIRIKSEIQSPKIPSLRETSTNCRLYRFHDNFRCTIPKRLILERLPRLSESFIRLSNPASSSNKKQDTVKVSCVLFGASIYNGLTISRSS